MIRRCIQDVIAVRLPPMDKVGMIYIPEEYKKENRYIEGEIIAHGPGRRTKRGALIPVDVKVGDYVMLTPHQFTTQEEDGEMIAFCRESDIIGVTDGFHGNEMHKLWMSEGDNSSRIE